MIPHELIAALSQECPWCKEAVATAGKLYQTTAACRAYLLLMVQHADAEGVPHGGQLRAVMPEIHCRQCNDTRRILTDSGKVLVQLLRENGVITGAELEARMQAQQKEGQTDGR